MARAGEVLTAASCSWQLPVPLLYTDMAWLQADVRWFSGLLQAYMGMWLSNVLYFEALASQTYQRMCLLALEPAEFDIRQRLGLSCFLA